MQFIMHNYIYENEKNAHTEWFKVLCKLKNWSSRLSFYLNNISKYKKYFCQI